MRKILIFSIISMTFLSCKKKDNEFKFDLGSYAEYDIATAGKITDTLFLSKVIIYYPPKYDKQDLSVKYPIIYFLHPFGGDYTYYKSVYDLGTIMSYLIAKGEIEPAILVFVNGRNPFGGSFYVNSIDTLNRRNVFGRYEDYIIQEVIPQVENLILSKDKLIPNERYIAGYSMGGYGAVWLSISNYNIFKKVASISGPLGFLAFSQPSAQAAVLNLLKQENSDFGNKLPQTFDSLYPTLGPGKPFTTFVIALSAAFSPKVDKCIKSPNEKYGGLEDSLKYIYIIAPMKGYHNFCAGIRLPVNKDLNSVKNEILLLWYSKDPLALFVFGHPNTDSVIQKGIIKYYISTGYKGDALETVIYSMDSALVSVMRQRYQNANKNPDDYITYKVVDGSMDVFKFPATHNQYVYQELGEVLRFFLRKQ